MPARSGDDIVQGLEQSADRALERVLGRRAEADHQSGPAGRLESWKAGDFEAMRSTMAEYVTFRGPLGRADGIEECLAGVRGLAEIITDIVVRQMVVEGDDVITWYDLHTKVASPTPTANWSHIEDGLIVAIRATFDPRELIAG